MNKKSKKIALIVAGTIILLTLIIVPLRLKLAGFYAEKGNENLNKHYYKSAFLDYEKASALLPEDEVLKIKLGEIYLLKNNLPEAEKEFKKAAKTDKNNPQSYILLLKTLWQEKKLEEAKKNIESISKKVSGNQEIKIWASRIYASLGNVGDALKIIDNNNSEEAKFYKLIILITDEKFEDAENLLNENFDSSKLTNKLKIMRSAFEKIKTSENNTYKSIVLAEALNEIDEPYLAEHMLRGVLEKNPNYRDALIFLGYSNLLKKDFKNARDYISKAIEMDPINGLSYYFLGKIDFAEGKTNDSKNNLEKAINFNYKNEESYTLLGKLQKQTTNLSGAEESFKKALELNPENNDILFELFDSLIIQKKFNEAIELAAKKGSDKFLGWVYLEKGDLEKSLEYLKNAEQNEPFSAFISLKLGELMKAQNNNSEAKDYFNKTVEFDLEKKWSQEALKQIN